MITYETIKSLPDVAKRANELGLKINEFQVAHYTNRGGGSYALFYDDGKESKKKKTAPAETAEKPKKPKRKTQLLKNRFRNSKDRSKSRSARRIWTN